MMRFFGLAALVAIGVAAGVYFGTRGAPPVPKAQQNDILERAKASGLIDGYSARPYLPVTGALQYMVGNGIRLLTRFSFCGNTAGPCYRGRPLLVIEYRHAEATQAEAIRRIAQARYPNANIKFFETTTLGG